MPVSTIIVLNRRTPEELRRCLASHVSGSQSVNFDRTDAQCKEEQRRKLAAREGVANNQSVNFYCTHAQVQ
jgi:hypothetical protein